MNRAELIERLWARCELPRQAVIRAVDTMMAHMIDALAAGERIEIRDFGSFGLHYRNAQARRDPRTGAPISVPAKYLPYFRPGKALRERVNRGHLEKKDLHL